MSGASNIEWTDATWNPVTGCTKVSQGCKHCYAETLANRFWKDRQFTDVRCHPERLDQPLRWRKPRRIFVNSMSDLFHEDVPDGFIANIFDVMAKAKQHTFQVLTKRPERMRDFVDVIGNMAGQASAPPNVWLGVSVENHDALWRVDKLRKTPAAVRFVSYEPALGPITFSDCEMHALDWIIAGGESGPKHRPADVAWFHAVADQCSNAGVAFFMKQDSHYRSGQQGRIPDDLWSRKEMPV